MIPVALMMAFAALGHTATAQDVPRSADLDACEANCRDEEAVCRAPCLPIDGSASLPVDVQDAIEECAAACAAPSVICYNVCTERFGSAGPP